MKVILTGGGTGGHVNPALAIGAAIEKYEPASEISYVGTPKGIENSLVPEKYPMYHVDIRGLRRSLSLSNLKTLWLTITSKSKAKKLLRRLQPELVIGTGGYVCWPIVAAAADLGIACALHESNAVPGLAVSMLEKKADIIFVNFEKTADALPHAKKVIHIGTPIRPEFFVCRDRAEEIRKEMGIGEGLAFDRFILSFGGSLGAGRLNDEMLAFMKDYGGSHPRTLMIHVSGRSNFDDLKPRFDALGLDGYENLRLVPYLFDMPEKMAAADLVICRSGATTLSELAVLGKPSILVPSPNVTNDQQTKNARLLSDAGAAILLPESELTDGKLQKSAMQLLSDRQKCTDMGRKAGMFAVENNEEKLYRILKDLVKQKEA